MTVAARRPRFWFVVAVREAAWCHRPAAQWRGVCGVSPHRGGCRVSCRFGSGAARGTPTGRCSARAGGTNSRPRIRTARRPCPPRNVQRPRTADTDPTAQQPFVGPRRTLPFSGREHPPLHDYGPPRTRRAPQPGQAQKGSYDINARPAALRQRSSDSRSGSQPGDGLACGEHGAGCGDGVADWASPRQRRRGPDPLPSRGSTR